MSHIKNVEAFEGITGICAGYGSKYNPAQRKLLIENMSALLSSARSVLKETGAAKTGYENATNAREVAYSDIDKLGMRILSELKSGEALSQTIADANSMVRKLRGYRTTDRSPVTAGSNSGATANDTATKPARKRVANGRDYGSIAQHFEKLLQTVSAEPTYQPNTPDLQVDALTARLQELHSQNTGVVQAYSLLSEARKKRNAVLYSGSQSLYSTAIAVKQQVKAIFGRNSEAYKEVSRITFTKLAK